MKCGRILLVHYPFTDDSSAKLRPVLVISQDEYNYGADIVVLPISSSIRQSDRYTYPINVSDPYFRETGLKRTSHVKWTKPLTIAKQIVVRDLGHLPVSPLAEIQRKLVSLIGAR
ncbi:MAG: type II toxin-antitoxin system PemK/MazF family toxin [Phycisphaerae bacterium]